MFSDHILSYEINNKIMKVNIKKKPHISKRKIEIFNMIRYGSSKTNTKNANLLKLPKYCLSIFIPNIELFNEDQIIPKSPIVIDQNMLFNHITISLSDYDLYNETISQTPEIERNQMFFLQNSSKLTTFNDNINIYNNTTTTSDNNDSVIDSSSTIMGFSRKESLYNYDFIKK